MASRLRIRKAAKKPKKISHNQNPSKSVVASKVTKEATPVIAEPSNPCKQVVAETAKAPDSKKKKKKKRKNKRKNKPKSDPEHSDGASCSHLVELTYFCATKSVKMTSETACWWNYSLEQLEGILAKKLEHAYEEVYAKLLSCGHPPGTAVIALECAGYGIGNSDVVTNIYLNCITNINVVKDLKIAESENLSATMKPLVASSIDFLVFFLCMVRDKLGRREAVWCLVMTNCHLGKAATIRVPLLYDDSIEDEKFNFAEACGKAWKNRDFRWGFCDECGSEVKLEDPAILKVGRGRRIDGLIIGEEEETIIPPEIKRALLSKLMVQVKDMEKQLKEEKDMDSEKILQIFERIENGHKLLQVLREKTEAEIKEEENAMGKEDILRRILRDTDEAKVLMPNAKTKTDIVDMRVQQDALTSRVQDLKAKCSKIEEREKKSLKRITALTKQCNKQQMEVEELKTKHSRLEQKNRSLRTAREQAEEKLREEMASKELALARKQEERRLYKEVRENLPGQKEALCREKEQQLQKLKDEKQRLEAEVGNLRTFVNNLKDVNDHGNNSDDPIELRLPSVDVFYTAFLEDVPPDRPCLICRIREASVVFLPCVHQVMCGNCNDFHRLKGDEARCPCCRTQVVGRIHVFGASAKAWQD